MAKATASFRRAPAAVQVVCAFAVCMLPQQMRQRDGGHGTPLCLNRIIVETSEIVGATVAHSHPRVTLPVQDERAIHIREVLRKDSAGDTLRAGIADMSLIDEAPVTIHPDLTVSLDLPLEGRRPLPPPPSITLMLSLPRPKILARLLPHIATLGVRQIVLCNAYRVERNYFDSFIVRQPELARAALITGVMQAGMDAYVLT
jgi:16S rRNA U1498 N3-methylase RsmE